MPLLLDGLLDVHPTCGNQCLHRGSVENTIDLVPDFFPDIEQVGRKALATRFLFAVPTSFKAKKLVIEVDADDGTPTNIHNNLLRCCNDKGVLGHFEYCETNCYSRKGADGQPHGDPRFSNKSGKLPRKKKRSGGGGSGGSGDPDTGTGAGNGGASKTKNCSDPDCRPRPPIKIPGLIKGSLPSRQGNEFLSYSNLNYERWKARGFAVGNPPIPVGEWPMLDRNEPGTGAIAPDPA